MTDFAARIGRVRIKGGGADLRIMPQRRTEGRAWQGDLIANARTCASHGPLSGYVIVALYDDGASSVGWRYDPARCAVPAALLPSWIAEVIRRDLIAGTEASETFTRMFERIEE